MDAEASDPELVQLIAGNARPAHEAESILFRRFARRVRLYGLRHLGTEAAADDLVQQVMLKVLEAIRAGRVEQPELLASFVLGTSRNVSSDARRAELRQQTLHSRREAGAPGVELPPDLSQADVLRLRSCLHALAQREAMVIRMSYWDDRSADEIGERLGLSAANVRVIRHRALGKLSECVTGQEAR